MKKLVKKDSIWKDSEENSFNVTKVLKVKGETWVHYFSEKNNKEYSCCEESFVQRFFEFNNYREKVNKN